MYGELQREYHSFDLQVLVGVSEKVNCEEIQNVIDVFSRVPVYLSVNLERIELCEIHDLILIYKQKQCKSPLDIVKSKDSHNSGIIHQLNLQIFVEL